MFGVVKYFLFFACVSSQSNSLILERPEDEKYRWFSIVSLQKHCKCNLAIEIPTTRANCALTKLIACPYDVTNVYQHWRWDGNMLKSRLNGLVWDLDMLLYGVCLGHPNNNSNQQFLYEKSSKKIYPNVIRLGKRKVIEIDGIEGNFIGNEITVANLRFTRKLKQMFEFRPIP